MRASCRIPGRTVPITATAMSIKSPENSSNKEGMHREECIPFVFCRQFLNKISEQQTGRLRCDAGTYCFLFCKACIFRVNVI